jgi:serine/threonine protein kinase
MHSLVRGL